MRYSHVDPASSALDAKQRALLQFASKITMRSEAIAPQDMAIMRAAGWSDLQIAEAIHVTALFATFNRVVNAFGLLSQDLLSTLEQEVAHGR